MKKLRLDSQNDANHFASKSDWQKLRELINSKEIGDIVSRKEMMEYIYNDASRRLSTTDTRRRQLVVCGYLHNIRCSHNVIIAGQYRVIKHVEPELTSSALEKMYSEKVKTFNEDRLPYCQANCNLCQK